MREIKFRFWSKILNHFVVPEDDIFVGALRDENMVVLQYTGFKDSQGKEIYYDYIVKFVFLDEDDKWGGTAVVTRSMNEGVGLLFECDDSESNIVHAVTEGGQIEEYWNDPSLWTINVIGNIYENPNLIQNQ